MIFALCFFSSCRYIPIERHRCGANINGIDYDVKAIADLGQVYKFSDPNNDYDYYIRLCDDLDKSQLPFGSKPQFGVNGVRFNKISGETEPIAFHDTQEYDYVDFSYPDNGFVISTHAQSSKFESEYKFYKVTFIFIPGEEPLTNYSGEPLFFPDGQTLNIALQFITSYAKPKTADVPPDPPLPPTCKYVYNSKLVYPFGIDLKLRNMNLGPHGMPITIDGDLNKFALYQPCGFSDCPVDFYCGSDSHSSIWVCSRDNMTCSSYAKPVPTISNLYEDPDEGLLLSYNTSNGKQVLTSLICNYDIDHDKTFVTKALLKGETLEIQARSSNPCMKPLEIKPAGSCQAHLVDDLTNTLDIDLEKMNNESGWTFKVSNQYWKGRKMWMRIQPCGPLPCPGDICPDSTGATIWLCEDLIDGRTQCYDYGLFSNLVNIEKFAYTLTDGLSLSYEGTDTRNTHIKLLCNNSLPPHTLAFKEHVGIMEGDDLSVFAYSSDACPLLAPTSSPLPPPPTETLHPTPKPWTPPQPQPTTVPPAPAPTSSIAYISNQTHSIKFDMYGITFEKNNMIVEQDLQHSSEFSIHGKLFKPIQCPTGALCFGPSLAEVWGCWPGDNKKPMCYPLMLASTLGTSFSHLSVPMTGVTISTKGYYNTILNMDIVCDQAVSGFELEDLVVFRNGNTYTLTARSSSACAKKEVEPPIPDPPLHPTPQPLPNPVPISYQDDKYSFSFDSIPDQNISMTFDTPDSREYAYFLYSPKGIISCPLGYDCLGTTFATAWKCWTDHLQNKICFSLADARYQPELVSSTSIVYIGGYSGYSLSTTLTCNPDVPENQVRIPVIAKEDNMNRVFINMMSSMFCSGRANQKNSSVGGVIFSTFLVGTALYFIGGSLFIYFTTSRIEVPNKEFWKGCIDYIASGSHYVLAKANIAHSDDEHYEQL